MSQRTTHTAFGAAAAAVLAAAQAARADVVETRNLEESIAVADPAGFEVVVDNVFGSIRVVGHDRSTIEMTAIETIRADTQADLERARTEVGLRTEREERRVAFDVGRLDGECDCERWGWGDRWDDYVVEYDIELRVPREVALDLSTVNRGDITVEDVRGDFELNNVNGAIEANGLRGSGELHTVNGRLVASFARSPAAPTSFETVNGEVEVTFPRDVSADLEFTTMNGEIWTDFEVAPLQASPAREETRGDGRFIIRSGRSGVRIAAGGPVHSFKTLNGDIYVRRAR